MKHSIESWNDYTLGEVAEFINGRAFKTTEWEDNGRPIIRIQDLTGKVSDPHFTTKIFDPKYLVQKNDLLVSWSATLDAFVWNREDGWLNQHIFKVKENPQLVIRKFLYYFIKKEIDLIRRQIHGSTMKHITKRKFTSITIRLPPIQIQNRIIKILEKAEQLKQWRKEADKLTSDYLYSVFLEMFGDPIRNPKNWNIRKLGDVCTSITDGPHVSPNYVEKGIPFISVHNIIDGFFDLSDIKYISREDHERFCRRSKPERGDVLYSKGGTTGFAKRIDVDFEFSIWVHLALLKFSKELLDPIFLETCLNSNYCKMQAKRLTRGIANKDLVLSQMARVRIIVPPIGLQKRFSEVVDQVERIKNYQKQTGWQIDDLYNTLMQKAFRGELNC